MEKNRHQSSNHLGFLKQKIIINSIQTLTEEILEFECHDYYQRLALCEKPLHAVFNENIENNVIV